jgi:hypothetical protein
VTQSERTVPVRETTDRVRRPPSMLVALAWATAAGVVLGLGDVAWSARSDSSWAVVANTAAGWGAAAFVLGFLLRLDPARSAVAGVVLLVVAVEAYYADFHAGAGLGGVRLDGSAAQAWIGFSVLAGALLGAAGAVAGARTEVASAAGVAVGASVPFGAALHLVRDAPSAVLSGTERDLVILGVGLLCCSLRHPRTAPIALALCVPGAYVVASMLASAGIPA